MRAMLDGLAGTLPAWVPACLIQFVRRSLDSMLHASAITFGLVFQFNSIWHVVVNKQAFEAISYGTGAAAIMGAWGALWQVNRYLKKKLPAVPAEGQG
jgi:hypothetical protein